MPIVYYNIGRSRGCPQFDFNEVKIEFLAKSKLRKAANHECYGECLS